MTFLNNFDTDKYANVKLKVQSENPKLKTHSFYFEKT